jgi:hypothetical protein
MSQAINIFYTFWYFHKMRILDYLSSIHRLYESRTHVLSSISIPVADTFQGVTTCIYFSSIETTFTKETTKKFDLYISLKSFEILHRNVTSGRQTSFSSTNKQMD